MTTIATRPSQPAAPDRWASLAGLVDEYATSRHLPPADWLTQLKLHRPNQNLSCLSRRRRFVKRAMDIVGALTLIVMLTPVLIVVPLLIRLTSPGAALFSQTRVGLNLRKRPNRRRLRKGNWDGDERRIKADRRSERESFGKPFEIYKFRTMRNDAERNGPQLAVAGDPRVTTLGRFLRRTRIDELPQLWNVLKGEMSLVGPRPERPQFVERLTEAVPGYLDRLGLRPGLTGLAQVMNGYDTNLDSVRKKVAFDLLYLQNCCFRNDLKILLRTITVVITGRGAL